MAETFEDLEDLDDVRDKLNAHATETNDATPRREFWCCIGQSIILGVTGSGVIRNGPGEPDEIHPRVFQYSAGLSGYGYDAGNPGDIIPCQEPVQDVGTGPANGSGSLSPVLAFGKRMATIYPTKQFVTLTVAQGGSGFNMALTTPRPPFPDNTVAGWSGPTYDLTAGDDTVVTGFIYDIVLSAANDMISRLGYTLGGFICDLGYAEGGNASDPTGQPPGLTRGDMFKARLVHLIESLRENIQDDANGPHTRKPWIHASLTRGFTHTVVPHLAADAVVRDLPNIVPHTAVILLDDIDGLYQGDGLATHPNADSCRIIGARFADAARAAMGNTLPLAAPYFTLGVSDGAIAILGDHACVIDGPAGSGTSVVSDSRRGDVIDFDGTPNAYVRIKLPYTNNTFPVSSYTIAAWIRSDNVGQVQTFFGTTTVNAHINFYQRADGKISGGHLNVQTEVVSTTTLVVSKWYFAAVTYDLNDTSEGPKGTLRLYIDGKQEDAAEANTVVPALSPQPQIGLIATLNPWDGRMDQISLWPQALSAAKVMAEYLKHGKGP